MDINQLLESKREKVKAAEEIRDRVYRDHDGEWTGDDEKKFDALMDEAEKLQSQIDRLAKLDAAARALESADKPLERRSAPVDPNRHRSAQRGKPSTDRKSVVEGND